MVNHAQAVRRLGQSRDDLLIMTQVPTDMALDFYPFLSNPIIAVAAAGHPLCAASSLSLADLSGYPLLVREVGSGTRRACEEYCQQKRVRFAQQLEIGSSEAQCEGVLAGLGLALLPRHAVQRELASGLLCQLPVQELPLQRSWCLVSQRGRQLSPVARAFADFIQQRRDVLAALEQRFNA